jgi:PAS domain S-box-containing protein
MKILIVDDHAINRKLLRVTLEAEGVTTVEAADGMEALAILQAERDQPMDAILADIFMPGMDGFRLCNAVRKSDEFGHLPFVIYTSTYTSPGDEKLALEAGADRYIRRPCPTATLIHVLHEVVAAAQERALERPHPFEELEVTREYNEALIKKLEEKNTDLERAVARQKMLAELSQHALATSSPLVSAAGQGTQGAVPETSAPPRGGADALNTLFGQAAGMVASALDLGYCAVWEALPGGVTLRYRAGVGGQGDSMERTVLESATARSGIEGLASGVTIRDGEPPVTSEGTGTLAVAIPGLNQPFGILEASAGAPRSFKEEDIHFLQAIAGVLATALQRQQAEEQVLEQREWLRVTLTSIGDGVIVGDPSGLITFLNPVAASLTGWRQNEALGQRIQVVFNIINAQTRQPAEDLTTRVFKERRAVSLDNSTVLLSRDGREIPIEDSAAPILDAAGDLAGVVLVFHDVAEKRQAQTALLQSAERLKWAQEIAHLGSWELDLETNELTWSDEVYQIFSLAPQEFGATYEAFLEHVHPDDRAAVDAAYSDSLRENRDGYEIEHRVVRQSTGEIRIVHEKGEHRRDDTGKIVRSIGMVHDITERKQAEEATRRAKEEWERTFDSVPDLIAIIDDRFRIVRANRAMAQRLGLMPEQCVGNICHQYVHGLGQPPTFCPHARTLADGQEHVTEVHEEHLGGDFLVSTTPLLDPQGKRIGSVHVARDITDRKRTEEALRESEERFRSLAEGLPELVWVSDADGKATYLNPQYREYAGTELGTVEERLQLIHPEDLARANELWSEAIRNGSDYEDEYRLRRHDGQYRWFLTRCVLKRTQSGEIDGWIGTSTDIHDQKQAEEVLEQRVQERTAELQASQEALIQAERLTIAGKLAASLAHEINNPLQSVMGCLELSAEALKSGQDPSTYLEIAHREVHRTVRIVSQLRSLGRPIQKGRKEPTDLNSLMSDVLLLNKKQLDTNNIKVLWEPDTGLPLVAVTADPMRQVFLNLVINATDAMPEGGQLRLRTERTRSKNGVRVVFADTGTGIPPDMLPHIFEAFYSTKSEGLGMGLFVCQGIVEQHGGRIEVESEPDAGTTFTVWLPT